MADFGSGFFAGTLYSYLKLDNKEFTTNLNQSQKQVHTFGESIEINKKKIIALGAIMTAAGGIIVASLSKMVSNTTALGDAFYDMSKRTGMSVEMLSALKYAAEQSGASIETIETGMRRLSKNLYDASLGGGEAKRSFDALGISVVDSDGKMKSMDTVILEVAEKFKGMKDGAEKAAIAQELFGRSGMMLIPLLNEGKEGIISLSAEAKKLGIVFTTESAKGAADLDDAQKSLNQALAGTGKTIAETLQPILLSITQTITGVVSSVTAWMKEHPELTKVITLTTAALGAFMVVVGPLLIALPLMKNGFTMLKGALTGIGPLIGKIALAGAAFYVGWQLGRAISDFLGLDKAIQGVFDITQLTFNEMYKISMLKMGWTEQGKQALFLRDSLVEIAKKLDPTVTGLRSAIIAIKGNEEAYNNLNPRLRRIVDGMVDLKIKTTEAMDELSKSAPKTQENIDAIQGIIEASKIRIEELTLSETDFKIAQLDREYQKNLEVLNANRASKEEFLIVERQHSLDLQKVRDDAYIARKEKEKKQKEEEEKEAEILLKAKIEEFQKDEERWATHQEVIEGLRKEQQDLILAEMQERDMWRLAELTKVNQWELDQKTALYNRLQDQKINFQQYQEELNLIKQLGEDKRESIENEARERQEKAEREKNQRLWSEFESIVSQKQASMGRYFDFLSNINTVYTALAISNLNSWYDEEYKRIMGSLLSNEEKEKAISTLNSQMAAKKAELDAASAKRERALAIAQAIANTAVAITTAMKYLPWPLNLAAIAFAIATGAAQIAAIGGAYKGPGIGDFGGGGEGTGGGGNEGIGGGGGGTGGGGRGGGGGGEIPRFQEGTGGYIIPPRDFMVGEAGPELVHMRGTPGRALMSITPVSQSREPGNNITISIPITVTAVDASHFKAKIQAEVIPVIKEAIMAGLILIPRSRVK